MNEEKFMSLALEKARLASENGEIPVGAVLVKDGEVICSAYNGCENGADSTSHAELSVIREGCAVLGSKWLLGCELYVTLEPCPMCAGAIINSRIDRVIFGVGNPKAGAFGSVINLNSYPFNHKVEILRGVLEEECGRELSDFFQSKREK